MRPIDSMDPITFTFEGYTFKQLSPDVYVIVNADGTETPITKDSNLLMEALLAGTILNGLNNAQSQAMPV